jgi:hypothetical protein
MERIGERVVDRIDIRISQERVVGAVDAGDLRGWAKALAVSACATDGGDLAALAALEHAVGELPGDIPVPRMPHRSRSLIADTIARGLSSNQPDPYGSNRFCEMCRMRGA